METKERKLAKHLKMHESLLCSGEMNPEQLDKILYKDFFEFGSSGRIWDKKSVMKELVIQPSSEYSIREFKVISIGKDAALVTYIARLNKENSASESLRSSIWKNFNGEWKIIFHQGTPIRA